MCTSVRQFCVALALGALVMIPGTPVHAGGDDAPGALEHGAGIRESG